MNVGNALEILIGAKTDANYAKTVQQVKGDIGGLEKAAGGLKNVFATALAGLSVGALLKESSQAASDYQVEMLKLDAVVRATGGAAGFTAQQLSEMARAEDLATLGSANNIREAMSVLLTFKSVQGEVFERAISSASDMSAVFGQDLKGAVTQLGKALEDPVKGVGALAEVGVTFSDTQKEMIQGLVDSGQMMQAQGIILEALEGQVGGASEAMASGMAGALDTLGFHWTEMLQNIGGSTNSIFMPVVNGISDALATLNQNFDAFTGSVQLLWADAVDFVNASALGLVRTIRNILDYIPDAGARVAELDQVIAALENPVTKASQVEQELIANYQHASEVTLSYTANTAAMATVTEKSTKASKEATKAAKEQEKIEQALSREKERQIDIINKLASDYERSLNPDQDWERVDALKGLTGEYLQQAEILYDQNKALEDRKALEDELEQYAIDESRRMDERLKKQRELLGLQRQASSDFKEMFIGAITSGGSLSDVLGASGDFLGSSRGKDLSFGNLFGEIDWSAIGLDSSTLGAWGSSLDGFIEGLGGMDMTGSILGGLSSMASGTSRGSMEGIGQIAGSFIPGLGPVLGGTLGKYLGGALSDMGIGGAGPYEGKGFQISGSMNDYQLAALASNNKGTSTDVYDAQKGTFGKWQVEDVLGGNASLGQSQLQMLVEVDKNLTAFNAGLDKTVIQIGDAFGMDLLPRFEDGFNAALDISGNENFGEKFAQWMQDTSADAVQYAISLATEGQDNPFNAALNTMIADAETGDEAVKTVGQMLQLRDTFEMAGLGADDLNSVMIEQAGGLEALQAKTERYYALFFSEQERAEAQYSQMAADVRQAFADMGQPVPQTEQEFRNLVNSLDQTTAEGAAAHNQMMSLANGLYVMQSAAASAQSALDSLANIAIAPDARAEAAWNSLNSDLSEMGLETLPKNRDALDEYLATFDKNNEAQYEQIAFLEKNASVIDGYYSDLERTQDQAEQERQRQIEKAANDAAKLDSAANQASEANGDYIDSLLGGADDMLEYIRKLTLGDLSTLTNEQQLTAAKNAYASALSGGDSQAIQSAADTYLEILKSQYGDSADYNAAFANVLTDLTGFASGGIARTGTAIAGNSQLESKLSVLEDMLTEQQNTNRILMEQIRVSNQQTDALIDNSKPTTPVAAVKYA